MVSSGDGGWVHLAPHIASVLARRGFFVVGFDAKAYLAGFTSKRRTLDAADGGERLRRTRRFAARATGRSRSWSGCPKEEGCRCSRRPMRGPRR
jgi:type IV secretory pathway VirJ component